MRRINIIVVGLEAVFHRSDGSSRPYTYTLESPEDARGEGDSVATQIADDLVAHPDRVFDNRVAGIFLCGVLTYWSRQPNAYGYVWIRRAIPNSTVSEAVEVLDALDHLLFEPVLPSMTNSAG